MLSLDESGPDSEVVADFHVGNFAVTVSPLPAVRQHELCSCRVQQPCYGWAPVVRELGKKKEKKTKSVFLLPSQDGAPETEWLYLSNERSITGKEFLK